MNREEIQYVLDANTLEENLNQRSMSTANLHAELVETFSELVNNAAEHGMTEKGAQAHIRYVPHRKSRAGNSPYILPDPRIRQPGHSFNHLEKRVVATGADQGKAQPSDDGCNARMHPGPRPGLQPRMTENRAIIIRP